MTETHVLAGLGWICRSPPVLISGTDLSIIPIPGMKRGEHSSPHDPKLSRTGRKMRNTVYSPGYSLTVKRVMVGQPYAPRYPTTLTTIGWREEATPLCSEVPLPRVYWEVYPMSIRSFIHSSRERRKDSAQSALLSSHLMRI